MAVISDGCAVCKKTDCFAEPNIISCLAYSTPNKILNMFWHPEINTGSKFPSHTSPSPYLPVPPPCFTLKCCCSDWTVCCEVVTLEASRAQCHRVIICWDVTKWSNRVLGMYLQPVPCRGRQLVKRLLRISELLSRNWWELSGNNGNSLKAEVKSGALC